MDIGLTHIALTVTDIDLSLKFYKKYAAMQVVHRRKDTKTNSDVVWLSDFTRPFVIVLIKVEKVGTSLSPFSHLGVGCSSREIVDELCGQALEEGVLVNEPQDYGHPVGYWAFLKDPDGHTLELSYGQEIAFTVDEAQKHNTEQG